MTIANTLEQSENIKTDKKTNDKTFIVNIIATIASFISMIILH